MVNLLEHFASNGFYYNDHSWKPKYGVLKSQYSNLESFIISRHINEEI